MRNVVALAAVVAGALALTAVGAFALPCETCEPSDPVITTQTITRTLTVSTDRGRVTDGVAIDCPSVSCTRSFEYTRECVDGKCEAYQYDTVTLTLTPIEGYIAAWSGCVPQAADPSRCNVKVDANRTVSVSWTPTGTHEPAVAQQPTDTDGGGSTTPGTTTPSSDGTTQTVVDEKRPVAAEGAPGRRRPIRSTLRYIFRRTDAWTEFTALAVRHLPRGATVAAKCRGARCPDAEKRLAKERTMRLASLTHVRFMAGTVMKIRVSKPGRLPRVTLVHVRFDKAPRLTHPTG